VNNCEAGGFLLVFFQEDDGCVLAVRGEFGDFSKGEFVSVAVGGAGDVGGVWEEGAEEVGFFVEGRVKRGCEEDLRDRGWLVAEECGEFEGERRGCEVEVGAGCGRGVGRGSLSGFLWFVVFIFF